MGPFYAVWHYLKYTASYRKYWLVMFILVIGTSSFVIYRTADRDYNFWSMYLSALSTFLAVWILIVSLREEWLRDLPKKLTVHFVDSNTLAYKISAFDAPLLTKDDIRAWSQQIGRSLSGQNNLDLNYFEFLITSKTEYIQGNYYEHFEVNYYIDGTGLTSYTAREYFYKKNETGHISYTSKTESYDGGLLYEPMRATALEKRKQVKEVKIDI